MRLHPVLALLLLVPISVAPGAAALAPTCLDAPFAHACASGARDETGNLTAHSEAQGVVPLVVAWERRSNATVDADDATVNASTNGTNPLNARPLGVSVGASRAGAEIDAWTCLSYLGVVHGPCYDPTVLPKPPTTLPQPDPQPLVDGALAIVNQLVCTRPRPHLCLLPV